MFCTKNSKICRRGMRKRRFSRDGGSESCRRSTYFPIVYSNHTFDRTDSQVGPVRVFLYERVHNALYHVTGRLTSSMSFAVVRFCPRFSLFSRPCLPLSSMPMSFVVVRLCFCALRSLCPKCGGWCPMSHNAAGNGWMDAWMRYGFNLGRLIGNKEFMTCLITGVPAESPATSVCVLSQHATKLLDASDEESHGTADPQHPSSAFIPDRTGH